ncbi:MAG: outer membrane beta-barrel protein [Bacteroidota bacterium]
MKFKTLALTLIACCSLFSSNAQKIRGDISGVVTNFKGQPLAGATLVLVQENDTSFKKILATNELGKFVFKNLPNDNYLLIASYAGCIKYTSRPIMIDSVHQLILLPVIVLYAANTTTLQAVVVTGQKKMIEQKLDRIVVNVDAMITAAGGNALDVLAKSPGVMVDLNDNISLNGKSGVLVLIDERLTYMTGQNLADYLKSLPAGILDKVELMSNPPAKYDASGNAVINIILKKNRIAGFNGNISTAYNQGIYAKINSSLNINYKKDKFNLFGNFSYSDNKDFTKNDDNRYFYNDNQMLQSVVLLNSHYTNQSNALNGRIGIDYFVSRKTTYGLMLTAGVRPKTDKLDYTSNQYDGNMTLDSTATGSTKGSYQWENYSINLNMQHKFDSIGKVLTADADYINYYSTGNQLSQSAVYLPDGSLSFSNSLLFKTPANINIWSVKADYTQPIKGKATLDAGVKSSYVSNNNQINWFSQTGNSFTPDDSKSDHFIYSENINAAYITAAKQWKRWAAKAGLRLENTTANGHQIANSVVQDAAFRINYTSLFPSLYTSYKLDSNSNNTLTISYSRRIRRPGYQQLNPFLFYHDKYTYSTGNPDLSPEYSNYIELRYNYKHFAAITFSYGSQASLIYSLSVPQGNLLITKPENFSSRQLIGVLPNVSFSPFKWWSVNANAVILFFVNKNNNSNMTVIKNTNIHEIEIINQFNIKKSWNAELTGFFPGRQSFGQTQAEKVYNISAGIQKNILKSKGSLRLKVNDIFHTMNPSTKTVGINQITAFHSGRSDTRQVGISFLYRFGKAVNARKRNHNTGGADDEEKRTN